MTAPDREDLRRRLYRPDAGEVDVVAYRTAVQGAPGSGDAVTSPDAGTPSAGGAGRRLRGPVVAVAAGVALVVLLGVARTAGSSAAPAPVPTAAASVLPPPAAAPLPTAAVDAPTRFVLIRNLLGDHDAGLGAWLDQRFGVRGLPRDRFVETHGAGDAVLTVPGTAADGGGRLTVLLVLAQDGQAGWTTARLVMHDDRTIHLEPTSERFGGLRAGVPAIGRLDFTARTRPLRLLVTAPDDVEWGVAVLAGP